MLQDVKPFQFRVGQGLSSSGEGAEAAYAEEVKLRAPGFVKDRQLEAKVLHLVRELLEVLESSPATEGFKEETFKHQGVRFTVVCFLDQVRVRSRTCAIAAAVMPEPACNHFNSTQTVTEPSSAQ